MFTVGIDCRNLEGNRTGVGRVLENLLKHLIEIDYVKNNFQFHLFFKGEIPKDDFLNNPIFIKKILKLSFFRPSFLVYFVFFLPWVSRKTKFDAFLFPGYMIPLGFKGKTIVTMHDVVFFAHPEWFPLLKYRLPYKIFANYALKISKAIIAVSDFSKKEIIKYCPKINPDKIFAIPLAVENKFKKENNEVLISEIKSKYDIKKDFILFLGQILPRRHIPESMLAFEKIAEKFPDLQFLVAGANPRGLNIEEQILLINKNLKREALVRKEFINDADLPLLYSAAKLSIYLSEYEGFGLPPLESLSCGTPALIGPAEVFKEVLGDAAFYVKNPKDAIEISKEIVNALTNEKARSEVLETAIIFKSKFSWEAHALKMAEILKSVCQL